MILNDVPINLRQKQFTGPFYIDETILQLESLGKVNGISLNGSGCKYLKIQSMDVILSELDILRGTSYVSIPRNHKAIINVKST